MAAFSEALERAQDPTLAELPGAREAGEAMAALQRQMEDLGLRDEIAVDEVAQVAEVEASDAGAEPAIEPAAAAEPSVEQVAPEEPIFEPIDVAPVPLEALVEEAAEAPRLAPQQPVSVDELEPAAEIEPDQASPPEPEAELGPELAAGVLDAVEPIEDAEPGAAPEPATSAVMSPYSTEVVEPDWFADGDFSWLEAAAAATGEESADERTEEASAPVDAPAAPAPADAPSTERAGDLGEVASEAETQAEAVAEPEVASEAETPAEAVAEETAFEPLEASVQPAVPTQPVAAPAPSVRASARRQDEEELMWLGDEFDAAELELETPGWGSHPAAAPPPRTEPQPLLELSDAELAQLASDEGWDPTEVEAIRTFLGRRSSAADASEERLKATATGAPDDVHPLDEAAPAAFGARAPADPATPPEGPAVLPESGGVQRRAPAIGEADVQGIAYEQDHDPAGQTERDWLRGRRGPAATAYRRLRRLFPG